MRTEYLYKLLGFLTAICFYSPTYLFNDLFISARTPTLGCNPYTLDYSLILLYSLCCSNFLAVATGRSSGWFLCPFDISFLILIFFLKKVSYFLALENVQIHIISYLFLKSAFLQGALIPFVGERY